MGSSKWTSVPSTLNNVCTLLNINLNRYIMKIFEILKSICLVGFFCFFFIQVLYVCYLFIEPVTVFYNLVLAL